MAQSEITKIWEAGAAAKEKELLGQLLIAQGNYNQGEYGQENVLSGDRKKRNQPKPQPTPGQQLEREGKYIDTGELNPQGKPLMIKGGMPPDVNTPWLPGGQSTEGIPNVDNPKLKEVLKKRKGIKQQNPGLDIPDFLKNIDIKPRDLLKILQLIPAAGGALLAPQLQIGQSGPAPTKIAELNPAQIKALEELKGVDKLPPTERLQRMREITEKVKGLA